MAKLKSRDQGMAECRADLDRLITGREFYRERVARIQDNLAPRDLESLEEKFADLDQRIEDLKDILETYRASVA